MHSGITKNNIEILTLNFGFVDSPDFIKKSLWWITKNFKNTDIMMIAAIDNNEISDDIFEKIDTSRMQQLVEIISKPDMGQVIITDTNKKRVEEYFEGRGDVGFFEL